MPPPTLDRDATPEQHCEYVKRHRRWMAMHVRTTQPQPKVRHSIRLDTIKSLTIRPWDPGRFPDATDRRVPIYSSSTENKPPLPYTVPEGTLDIRDLDPSTPPPQKRRFAQASEYWPHYYGAECLEISTLKAMDVWELVPRSEVTKGAKVLQPRWAYDHKKGPDGKIIKAKARFTAMGCMQTPGVDYADTYASVMTLKTFRTLLALLAMDPTLDMEQWDCKAAYVHAILHEAVFVVQPPGHEDPSKPRHVLRLKKALYGLKQAGSAWQKHLRKLLYQVKAKPLGADPACYILKEGRGWVIIPTHVDDIFPIYNKEGKVLRDRIWNHLSKALQIGDSGPIEWALKTRIYRDRERGILKISQEAYTLEVLTRFDMLGCNGAPTPFPAKVDLPDPSEVTEVMEKDAKDLPIRELIGCLQWLAEISRPDIRAALHKAQVRQHKPNRALWDYLKRVLRYLKAYPHLGMVYKRPSNFELVPGLDQFSSAVPVKSLDQFVDIAFAPDLGTNKGKSVIGGVTRFYGNPVSWFTKRSRRVCNSTSEAECNGLTEISSENVWHRDLHQHMGLISIDHPTIVWEDNSAAVALSGSNTYHARSKHFGLEWYQTKERVELGEMEVLYIPTTEQLADILTKVEFTAVQFHRLRDALMGGHEWQNHFGRLTPPDPRQIMDEKGVM